MSSPSTTDAVEAPSEEGHREQRLSLLDVIVLIGFLGGVAMCAAVVGSGSLRDPSEYLQVPGQLKEFGAVILGTMAAVIVGLILCQTTAGRLGVAVAGVGVVLVALGFGVGVDGTVSSRCTVIEGHDGQSYGYDYLVLTRDNSPIVAAVGGALLALGLAASLSRERGAAVLHRIVVAAVLITAALALGVAPDREIASDASDGFLHVPATCGGDAGMSSQS